MFYKKILCLACTLLVLFSSCKKEKIIATPSGSGTLPSYGMLKKGNYWIYQLYQIDPVAHTKTPQNTFDSVVVEDTVTFYGKTYFIRSEYTSIRPYAPFRYFLRDSAGCIVDQTGSIFFSMNNFASDLSHYVLFDITGDSLYHGSSRMVDKDLLYTVPCGTFTTRTYHETMRHYSSFEPAFNTFNDQRYSLGVGIVAQTFYKSSLSNMYSEWQLIRYHAE